MIRELKLNGIIFSNVAKFTLGYVLHILCQNSLTLNRNCVHVHVVNLLAILQIYIGLKFACYSQVQPPVREWPKPTLKILSCTVADPAEAIKFMQ